MCLFVRHRHSSSQKHGPRDKQHCQPPFAGDRLGASDWPLPLVRDRDVGHHLVECSLDGGERGMEPRGRVDQGVRRTLVFFQGALCQSLRRGEGTCDMVDGGQRWAPSIPMMSWSSFLVWEVGVAHFDHAHVPLMPRSEMTCAAIEFARASRATFLWCVR